MAIRVEIASVVPSNHGKNYMVSKWAPGIGKFTDILDAEAPGPQGHAWECSCPSWTRNMPRSDCKHILRIKAWWDWTKRNLQVVPMTGVKFRLRDRMILDELMQRRPDRMTSQETSGEEERMGRTMAENYAREFRKLSAAAQSTAPNGVSRTIALQTGSITQKEYDTLTAMGNENLANLRRGLPAQARVKVSTPKVVKVPCETCGVVHKKSQKWCKVTDVEKKLAQEKEKANAPHRFKILEVE